MRDPDLQSFIDATAAAFAARTTPGSPIEPLARNVFGAARDAIGSIATNATPETLPVCQHLAPALVTAATASPETAAVADAFSRVAPRLAWRSKIARDGDPDGFAKNHANAVFVGIGGLEERDDIRIGTSLVAPGVLYPDHNHPPEEMYLALSDSEWRNADTNWTAPGIGGLFHNTPGITHAMRAGQGPLLAIWCLWSP